MTSLPWYKGGEERQHRVFDSTVRALKWLFPSLPGEAKDSVSVKKLLAGEGDWECVKEVLSWTINTEVGTVALPKHKLQELRDLLDIPTSQRRMGRKELERLVGKLRSMHLAMPGAVAHLYHIQCGLSQAGTDGLGCLLIFIGRSRTGPPWQTRQSTGPPTSPRLCVVNPHIWGSATPQTWGPGEYG